MKRNLFFISIMMMGILGLTGCKQVEKEKIQITYATYAPIQWDAIAEFNKTNDTYEVVCQSYLAESGDYQQYEDYLKLLNLQIMAGTAPDMFVAVPDFYFSYDDRDFVSYVEKGVLEDLKPYMERDFEEGEYLESVLYSFEKDGGVYALPYGFGLGLQIANAGRLQGVEDWTFSEMKAYMEEHPEIEIYDINLDRNELLRELILYGGVALDDYETIEECILFAWKYDSNNLSKEDRNINTKKALVSEISIASPDFWFALLTTWGENASFVGLPRESRKGILLDIDSISMNAASENKEGVWEFFKFLMSEEYQSKLVCFPVRTQQYEACWEYYTTKQSVEILYEESGEMLKESSMYYIRENGEVATCLSLEDKERMQKLIERASTFVWNTDMDAYQIIREEADSYYSGQKTIDEVMEVIKNRMGLYLEEKE